METGYSSQEKEVEAIDRQVFEMFWEPNKTTFSEGTTEEEKYIIKYDDPQGFSGSLVWNTRYVERMSAGKDWSPEHAVVSGLLVEWNPCTKTIIALRVEHVRSWLETNVFA